MKTEIRIKRLRNVFLKKQSTYLSKVKTESVCFWCNNIIQLNDNGRENAFLVYQHNTKINANQRDEVLLMFNHDTNKL